MGKIWALVKDGIVQNTIVAESDFIAHIQQDYDYCIDTEPLGEKPGIGWSYSEGVFSRPQEPNAN